VPQHVRAAFAFEDVVRLHWMITAVGELRH
jgi:hypothetical protein